MTPPTDDDVIVRVDGALGHLTLNRPRAINALTLDMVRLIDAALTAWVEDPAVTAVLVDGAGERGLCAGGDIRAIYEAARVGDPAPLTFWREEYRLNARLAAYPKPIITVMDGIVMGGGIGVSAHASHRVVTERSAIAMPEVGIGLFPDVGATHLLSHAPGEIGTHLALTGVTIGAADAMMCGLADRCVPSGRLAELVDLLREGIEPDTVLEKLTTAPGDGALDHARPWIDECYSADDLATVLRRLEGHAAPAAATAAAAIRTKSPTSSVVTLRALRVARHADDLQDCLRMEFRLSSRFLRTADLVEGVRAAVIDKDRNPRWSPARLEHVTDETIDAFFSPLADRELTFD
jgi:enoyl-CoA hydratase